MEVLLAVLFIIFATLMRLVPHAANFAPIAAIALFSGAVLPRRWSFIVPILAMIVSDFFLGFYSLPIMISVYSCFLVSVFLGMWARKQKERGMSVLGASLFGSILFFVTTNFAVWAWGGMYPHTISGLIAAYTMAIPFFHNTFFGDLFYTGALFGMYAVAKVGVLNFSWFRDKQMLRDPRY